MWESIGCSTGGQLLIAIVIVFNGRAGAKYHMCVFPQAFVCSADEL
jgi:cytosine/uracil/thiamine/allantoin permease